MVVNKLVTDMKRIIAILIAFSLATTLTFAQSSEQENANKKRMNSSESEELQSKYKGIIELGNQIGVGY